MFKFFSLKKKKPIEKDEKINSLIIEKLDRMIELLEQQPRESTENGKNIHLEHVQIDHLENIIFRLDHIEIDELSGKLLIGTNITGSDDLAVSLLGKIDKENTKKEAADEDMTSQQKMTKTEKGFRFHNGQ
ncbi:hypothetical protein BABA_04139 [Neobacillus bataviensis LMG 21833]|uniref:Uncharacterized protein n=1 Tax=Neobacillus bataviensis LMG 21833 TaxID=1117379 RepID=K6EB11_9BACI|nr:hypothetical protein [Neobacillus bataviensis]EKN70601.1 hypothetical protein BABA_04139 [Neobacillus bataviensis LMG 21833]